MCIKQIELHSANARQTWTGKWSNPQMPLEKLTHVFQENLEQTNKILMTIKEFTNLIDLYTMCHGTALSTLY